MIFDEDDLRAELERLSSATDGKPCPHCKRFLPKREVKKEGRNMGRPFVACTPCDFFAWQDAPSCKTCGSNLIEMRVKKEGKSKGKKFRNCPLRCSGAFRWVKAPAETDSSA